MNSKISNVIRVGFLPATLMLASIAGAQTSTTTPPTTPGIPTTAIGGMSTGSIMILLVSALIIGVGIALLMRGKDNNKDAQI